MGTKGTTRGCDGERLVLISTLTLPSSSPPPGTHPQMKKLLAETEKLSAEVLGLRGQSARLQLQLEVGASTWCHPLSPCHPSHLLLLLPRSSRKTTGTL